MEAPRFARNSSSSSSDSVRIPPDPTAAALSLSGGLPNAQRSPEVRTPFEQMEDTRVLEDAEPSKGKKLFDKLLGRKKSKTDIPRADMYE